MKKRILSLALALLMIISLLPVTAFAAAVETETRMPKLSKIGNISGSGLSDKKSVYYTFVDDKDEAGNVLGQKPKKLDSAPEILENCIRLYWKKSDNKLTITFYSINYNASDDPDNFLYITRNTTTSYKYSRAFDVEIKLVGTNVINSGVIKFESSGKLSIIGEPGSSLTYTCHASANSMIQKNYASDELLIKDANITLTNTYVGSPTAVICNNGNVTIENSTVTMYTGAGYGIICASGYDKAAADHEVKIQKGSNVLIEGGLLQEDGSVEYHSGQPMIATKGKITFDNSNVELHRADTGGETNNYSVIRMAPEFIGNYTRIQVKGGINNTPNKNYKDLTEEPGTDLYDAGYCHFIATCGTGAPEEPEEPECEHTYDFGFCTECGEEDLSTDYVAQFANKKYKSLAAAIYHANGQEIKLLRDVNYYSLSIVNDTKINLNGFRLQIKKSENAVPAITVYSGATLEIYGGSLRVSNDNKYTALIENNGTLVVTDVVIRGTELGGENAVVLLNNGVAKIEGASAVVAASKTKYAIVNKGTCEINIAKTDKVDARIQGVLAQEEGELALNAIRLLGKLSYTAGKVTKAEGVSVSAPSGYIWNQNALDVKDPVAEVDGVKYASLQEAIDKANGAEIKLLKDTSSDALEITKETKINIGSYKLYIKQTEEKTVGITVNVNATLTLIGGSLRVSGENKYAVLIENNGKLFIEDVAIRGTEMGNADAVVLLNNGEAEIKGVTRLVALTRNNCAIVNSNTGSCVIDITSKDGVIAKIYGAIDNDGELEEKGDYRHFGNKFE